MSIPGQGEYLRLFGYYMSISTELVRVVPSERNKNLEGGLDNEWYLKEVLFWKKSNG